MSLNPLSALITRYRADAQVALAAQMWDLASAINCAREVVAEHEATHQCSSAEMRVRVAKGKMEATPEVRDWLDALDVLRLVGEAGGSKGRRPRPRNIPNLLADPHPPTLLLSALVYQQSSGDLYIEAKDLQGARPDARFHQYLCPNGRLLVREADPKRLEPWQKTIMEHAGPRIENDDILAHCRQNVRVCEHPDIVRDALSAGADVPQRVLAEYPELAAEAAARGEQE